MNTAQRGGRGRVLAITFCCKEQRSPTSHEADHSERHLALDPQGTARTFSAFQFFLHCFRIFSLVGTIPLAIDFLYMDDICERSLKASDHSITLFPENVHWSGRYLSQLTFCIRTIPASVL